MKKEQFEWIHSWCDETEKNDLPRVLLIGDSITHNYQDLVRAKLKGTAYVDYIATSYSIDMKIYRDLIKNYVKDSKYDIIHFNHGLHGKYMSKNIYFKNVDNLLKAFNCNKIIIATSTIVYLEGNKIFDKTWNKKVEERNEVIYQIAKNNNYIVDDLYAISTQIPLELRHIDGIHYLKDGYEYFANEVSKKIKEIAQ